MWLYTPAVLDLIALTPTSSITRLVIPATYRVIGTLIVFQFDRFTHEADRASPAAADATTSDTVVPAGSWRRPHTGMPMAAFAGMPFVKPPFSMRTSSALGLVAVTAVTAVDADRAVDEVGAVGADGTMPNVSRVDIPTVVHLRRSREAKTTELIASRQCATGYSNPRGSRERTGEDGPGGRSDPCVADAHAKALEQPVRRPHDGCGQARCRRDADDP